MYAYNSTRNLLEERVSKLLNRWVLCYSENPKQPLCLRYNISGCRKAVVGSILFFSGQGMEINLYRIEELNVNSTAAKLF